jgi:formylglycine-generating enzyme required for sulfatase activity
MNHRIHGIALIVMAIIELGLSTCAAAADETPELPDPSKKAATPNPELYRQFAGKKGRLKWADNGLEMKFAWCFPGSFSMGPIQSVDGKVVNENQWIEELGRQADLADKKRGNADPPPDAREEADSSDTGTPDVAVERRETRVFLFHGFWLGQYEVSRREWKQILGTEPWTGRKIDVDGDDYPATYISWDGAMEFCRLLTERERAADRLPQGWEYTLPTEAQWERACRAGTTTRYSFGDNAARLRDYAWFAQKDEPYPHRVGQKKPNAWGLYDMHGNVMEWCRDFFTGTLPGGREPEVTRGTQRVQRGGHWGCQDWDCVSGGRSMAPPELKRLEFGFRVALRYTE